MCRASQEVFEETIAIYLSHATFHVNGDHAYNDFVAFLNGVPLDAGFKALRKLEFSGLDASASVCIPHQELALAMRCPGLVELILSFDMSRIWYGDAYPDDPHYDTPFAADRMLTVLRLDQVAKCANLKTLTWTLYEDGNKGDAAYVVSEVMGQVADLLREQYVRVNRRQLTVNTEVIWSMWRAW